MRLSYDTITLMNIYNMWSIKEIKQKGKKTLKNNLWTLLLIGLFMTIVVGKYAVNNDSLSNLNVLKQFIEDRKNGKELTWIDKENPEVMLNKYLDEMVSQMFSGNSSVITDVINDYNEKNNVTKGVFYTVFNVVTKGHEHVQKIIQTIASYENKTTILKILIIVVAAGGMAIKIFISYPIQIGETRIYLESRNYKKTKVYRMLYPFRKGRYLNVVKSMLRMEIYQLLWNLTIVGGIIKKYSYKMVMYIIAENPQISSKDAIRISREMMNGNKWRAFLLDLSFIGWNILQYITFGLAGIYVSPYYTATEVELYAFLRKEYIENKKYGYELLNDTKLYEENPETASYPDAFEFERKKTKIDYNKNYEPTSIILFFFIFSFVGWLWEVALYLFRDGILVNRGTLYGPWLPIYGTGCTLIVLLTKFKKFRKMLKNPFLTFGVVMFLCSAIEYATSWYIEVTTGIRYWDYTGVFLNINGRICLECSLFFGLGGVLCVYIVAPFLERNLQRLTNKLKISMCIALLLIFGADNVYSHFHPHVGEGISSSVENPTKVPNLIQRF